MELKAGCSGFFLQGDAHAEGRWVVMYAGVAGACVCQRVCGVERREGGVRENVVAARLLCAG